MLGRARSGSRRSDARTAGRTHVTTATAVREGHERRQWRRQPSTPNMCSESGRCARVASSGMNSRQARWRWREPRRITGSWSGVRKVGLRR
jgi:hypothetical protein